MQFVFDKVLSGYNTWLGNETLQQHRCRYLNLTLLIFGIMFFQPLHSQVELNLEAAKDATIFSETEGSNGAGQLFTGKTQGGQGTDLRRALVAFDLSDIPEGATITAVQFVIRGSKQAANNVNMHRMIADWGEGDTAGSGNGGGISSPAQDGDATWLANFFGTTLWNNPGGDFDAAVSANGSINNNTDNIFEGEGLISDVQSWVDGSDNFGWILINDENTSGSTVRMNSREVGTAPALNITYMEADICDVDGGQVIIPSVGNAISVCSGDGQDDFIDANVTNNSGTNGVWVITDDLGNFLDVETAPPFNFESAGLGICLIRFLSYEDGLIGLAEGNNVSDLEGCFSLSNSLTVTRKFVNGGIIEIDGGGTEMTICAGDGVGDPFSVNLLGGSENGSGYVISSISGTILGLQSTNTFDFEGAGPGICIVQHVSADLPFAGLQLTGNINDAMGCFDFSNAITITRLDTGDLCVVMCNVDGGELSLDSTNTEIIICAGDGTSDPFDIVLQGESGTNSAWIITDANGLILGTPDGPPFDLENAGAGVCMVYHISYDDGLTGLVMGQNIADLDGCFDLSNAITVTRVTEGSPCAPVCEVAGGTLESTDGGVELTICAGDGVPDPVDGVLTGNTGTSHWAITDTAGMILAVPEALPFDFEGAGGGVCHIYHVSGDENFEGLSQGQSIFELDGCVSISNPIIVTRETVGEFCVEELHFIASLTGTQQVFPITSKGGGQIDLMLQGNTLSLSGSVNSLGSDYEVNIGSHIHYGLAGSNGGVDFALVPNLGDDLTLVEYESADNTFELTDEQIDALLGQEYYINIHTTDMPAGELRGQILPVADHYFQTNLLGSHQVPSIHSDGFGSLVFTLSDTMLTVSGSFDGLSGPVATELSGGAHIHGGMAGQNGAVVFPLDITFDADTSEGTLEPGNNTFSLNQEQIDALLSEGLYVNVHSETFSSGELRGQIAPLASSTFRAGLAGTQESPTVCSEGQGRLLINYHNDGTMTVSGSVSDLGSPIDVGLSGGAHLHMGSPGTNGGVLFPLVFDIDTSDNSMSGVFLPADNTFDLDTSGHDALCDRGLYVNIHTLEFGGGEIRGQVLPLAKSYFGTTLSGANSVPPNQSSGAGNIQMELTDDQLSLSGSFGGLADNVDVSIAGGAHLHSGMAGGSGAVVFPLNITFDLDTTEGQFEAENNTFSLTQEQIDALLSEDLYVNIHSTEFPGGEIRGLVLGDQNAKPLGGFSIDSPEEGSLFHVGPDVPNELSFEWSGTTDPDGDPVVYVFQLSTDTSVQEVITETNTGNETTITYTSHQIDSILSSVGISLTESSDFFVRVLGSDGSVNQPSDLLTISFAPVIDDECPDSISGGTINIVGAETELTICAGDGESDAFDVSLEGNIGTNSAWVITDTSGNILGLPDGPPFDLEGAGAGVCEIWHVSFEDSLTGMELDSNIMNIMGCYALSNAITVTRVTEGGPCAPACDVAGGTLEIAEGGVELTICAGDSLSDAFDVMLEGNMGTNSAWIITDTSGNILGLPDGPPFDLEGAGVGVCEIWHVSFEDSLTGMELDSNIMNIMGCYALSNAITVTRLSGDDCPQECSVAGGSIAIAGEGSTEITVCADDGLDDLVDVEIEGTEGTNTQWIISDDAGSILMLPDAPPFNFEGAGAGICRIWNISYEEGLMGLTVGMNTGDLEGCFELSNSIVVNRLAADDCAPSCDIEAGSIEIEGGGTEITICANDGVSDAFEVVSVDSLVSDTCVYVITDEMGTILALPATSTIDLEGAGSGSCFIWKLGFEFDLEGLAIGEHKDSLIGCFDFSNSIEVIRIVDGDPCPPECDVNGGEIETDGGLTELTICAGDGESDAFEAILTGSAGETNAWVITDESGNILGLPDTSNIDLEGAGEGVCVLWNISFDGELTGLELDSNIADIEGCFAFSNAITITRNIEGDPCPLGCQPPDEIEIFILSRNKFVTDWAPVEGAKTYLFRARLKGTKKWKERLLRFGSRATTGAFAGATIEFQIQTICLDGTVSEFTEIMEVTLPTTKDNSDTFPFDDIVIYEELPNNIDLFPNPASDQITISYRPERGAKLGIYSISGQKVMSRDLRAGQGVHEVNVSALDQGVYIMTIVESGVELRRVRIIKL